MNTHMTIGLCAAVCIMVGTAAIAYRSEDFERGRLLTSHTNHFTRVTGLAPTASNLLHILVSPVNLYSNLPYTPASAVQVAYNNQIVDSLAILDITGIATQYPRLVKEHIMLCVHSNATHASVLRWCAKTLVETELDAQTGKQILDSIVTNTGYEMVERLSSAGDLAKYDQPVGYSLMMGALTGSNKYEKVIAENALLMYIQYVQRHSSAAATQQLLTADGECIDLGAVEQAVTNGFRLPFMSSLLTNVATKIRDLREQGSQPQP